MNPRRQAEPATLAARSGSRRVSGGRRAARGCAGLASVLLVTGCVHLRWAPAPDPATASSVAGTTSSPPPARRLFRVGYQGPEGSGSLRLALLVETRERYQARASDTFGRGLWSLELESGSVRFLDHRRREHCLTEREVRIPELALSTLPIDRLPDVLTGRLPAEPAAAGSGTQPADFHDREGRRWTASYTGGTLETWTLWSQGEPLLWWQRQERGGLLSHRQGSQLRWRQTVEEPLGQGLATLEVPPRYRAVECATLAPHED